MKRKVLTESQKRQLILKKIRQIIREEIERSLEEVEKHLRLAPGGHTTTRIRPEREEENKQTIYQFFLSSTKTTQSSRIIDSVKKYLQQFPLKFSDIEKRSEKDIKDIIKIYINRIILKNDSITNIMNYLENPIAYKGINVNSFIEDFFNQLTLQFDKITGKL